MTWHAWKTIKYPLWGVKSLRCSISLRSRKMMWLTFKVSHFGRSTSWSIIFRSWKSRLCSYVVTQSQFITPNIVTPKRLSCLLYMINTWTFLLIVNFNRRFFPHDLSVLTHIFLVGTITSYMSLFMTSETRAFHKRFLVRYFWLWFVNRVRFCQWSGLKNLLIF